MTGILLAIAGVLSTYGAFYLIAVTWPRLYYGPSDGLQIFLSSSLLVFSAFRVLPVAGVVAIVNAYAGAIAEEAGLRVTITYFIAFVVSTAAFRYVHRFRHGRRMSLRDYLWLAASIAFTGVGVALGALLTSWVDFILPAPSVAGDAIFTAAIVAIAIAAMQRMGFAEDFSERAIRRAIESNSILIAQIERECRKLNISRWVMSAIVVAEQMQRPRWFQRFENALFTLGAPVSVGPFQMRGSLAAEGRASVVNFLQESPASRFASEVALDGDSGSDSRERVIYALHNDAKPFVELCLQVRRQLIDREFQVGGYESSLSEVGVELGCLEISPGMVYHLQFALHARSDNASVVALTLAPQDTAEFADWFELRPGDTHVVNGSAEQFGQKWIGTIKVANSAVDRAFELFPLDNMEFAAKWDG